MEKLITLDKILKKLRHYTIAVITIEVICTGLIGLAASQIDSIFSPWTILILFCSFILIVILSYRYNYLKDFPSTLVESIKSDFSNQNLRNDYSRISLINDSIAKSLMSLNSQTCQLNEQVQNFTNIEDAPIEDKLCSQGIKNGLSEVIESFLKNLHNIIDSNQSKFTVGVYLSTFWETNAKDPKEDPEMKRGTFLIKDDLNLLEIIPENILDEENASGLSFEIQTSLKSSWNNKKAEFHPKLKNDNNLSVYTNVIPEVCSEDYYTGVLFIIGNNLIEVPNDFDDVTKIYSRIITNWINKYNECIYQKRSQHF